MQDTIGDFWKMMYENRVQILVLLNELNEENPVGTLHFSTPFCYTMDSKFDM